jgi:hypothetical protein
MDHRPDCVQGFGCHCPMDRTPVPKPRLNLGSIHPRWLAVLIALLRWP